MILDYFCNMRILVATLLTLVIFACGQDKSKSEVTSANAEQKDLASSNLYGADLTLTDEVNAENLATLVGDSDSLIVRVSGTINATCKAKGCWMTIDTGEGEEMRVTFKDYGFFVPKQGAEGKTAVFEGVVKKDIIDVETQRHYASDAGADEDEIMAITEPKTELTFVATGVKIAD